MLVLVIVGLLQGGPPDSLTLAEALSQARLHRGQATIAGARVAAARGAFRTAGAIPNPTVSYSHTESTPRQHFIFEQPLDWLARRGPDRRASRAGIDRARADSTVLLADLGQEVRVNFYRARAALESEALVRAQVAIADSLGHLASVRLAAGDISRFEQEQTVQESARERQTLSQARERSGIALADLARSIGWDRDLPPTPSARMDASLDQAPTLGGLVPDSVPALRAALADSAAAQASAIAAARARLPLPSLQTGAEWDDPGEPNRALAVIGFSIPLPLWQYGGGSVAQARAQAVEAAAQAREARLEVTRSLRQAQVHLEETARRARYARDSLLPASRDLRVRALSAYQAGETGVLPVLDAIRRESDAGLAAIEDLLAYQEAVAAWYALLGRAD